MNIQPVLLVLHSFLALVQTQRLIDPREVITLKFKVKNGLAVLQWPLIGKKARREDDQGQH